MPSIPLQWTKYPDLAQTSSLSLFSFTFFILAITKADPTHNFIGLEFTGEAMFYRDFARKFKQETILGAQIDIIADRFIYINFLYFRSQLFLPVAICSVFTPELISDISYSCKI